MNKEHLANKPADIRLYIATLAGGGSERVCKDLCNGFVSQGLSVELLLVNAFGPYLEQLDPRVRVMDFKASRGLVALWGVCRHVRSVPKIPILVFGFNLGVALLLARRIGWHKVPIIYREGCSPHASIEQWMQWAYSFAIGTADKVVAQSRMIRDELVSLGVSHEKIVVIPNPCLLAQSREGNQKERTAAEAPLVVAVGRLSVQKGFDRLIRGFKSLHQECPKARLVILGEGSERQPLQRLVNELELQAAISLPGFVDDLTPWHRRASLFVLSSRYEGQPNALMEAIARGCPVLCAKGHGGVVDLMHDCGLEDCLVPDEQFEQLFAERVHHVLSMDDSRWQTAQEKLAQLTDFDTVLRQYLDVCGVSIPPNDSASRKP